MMTINVFIDTSIVNRIVDIDNMQYRDPKYEEDKKYLSIIRDDYVDKGLVTFIVNPSVKQEIDQTKDNNQKARLLRIYSKFKFSSYNKTIFPFTFPVRFVTEEEASFVKDLCNKIPGFEKDQKIFLDAVTNPEVDVLLTTDRKHLAEQENDCFTKPVFTPKHLYGYLQKLFPESK